MSEQQLADLFTEQLDRVLAGETLDPPAEELSELLNLGQQLTEVRFQAGPTAQTAFQGQMARLNSTSRTGWGLPKAMMIAVGAGIGLITLISFIFVGAMLDYSEDKAPATIMPVIIVPMDTPPPTATQISATPTSTSKPPDIASDKDTLPAFSSQSDTMLITATPLPDIHPLMATPSLTPTIETIYNQPEGETDNGADGKDAIKTDHDDRGHGNDADGIDEDNPGKSNGVGGDDKETDKSNTKGGKSGGKDK